MVRRKMKRNREVSKCYSLPTDASSEGSNNNHFILNKKRKASGSRQVDDTEEIGLVRKAENWGQTYVRCILSPSFCSDAQNMCRCRHQIWDVADCIKVICDSGEYSKLPLNEAQAIVVEASSFFEEPLQCKLFMTIPRETRLMWLQEQLGNITIGKKRKGKGIRRSKPVGG